MEIIEQKSKKPYENVSCDVIDIETQGVLCVSESDEDGGGLYGGLSPYRGGTL